MACVDGMNKIGKGMMNMISRSVAAVMSRDHGQQQQVHIKKRKRMPSPDDHDPFSFPFAGEDGEEAEEWLRLLKKKKTKFDSEMSNNKATGCKKKQTKKNKATSTMVEGVLKDVLLSWLPVRMIFRMRGVSRTFRQSLLQDHACSPNPSLRQESWLLLLRIPCFSPLWDISHLLSNDNYKKKKTPSSWRLHAFSNVERKRFLVPPTLNEAELNHVIGNTTKYLEEDRTVHMPCVSAANGLLCTYIRGLTTPRIAVFNCLTGHSELLDPPLAAGSSSNMLIHEDSGSMINGHKIFMFAPHDNNNTSSSLQNPAYYILLLRPLQPYPSEDVSDWFEHWTVQLYNSSVSKWKVPQSISLATQDSDTLIDCDYFSFSIDLSTGRAMAHIYGYHASRDQWFRTTLTEEYPFRTFGRSITAIVKHDGKLLMLIGRLKEYLVLEVFRVSERSCDTQLVSVMPKHLSHMRGCPTVTAGGNLFCVSFIPRNPKSKRRHVVVYDMSKGMWYGVPVLKAEEEDGCRSYDRCVAIVEPRKAMAF